MASLSWNVRVLILVAVAAISLAGLFLFAPVVPQDQASHNLADQRTLLDLPNFWNVASNVPFFLIGILGLRVSGPLTQRVFFFSIFLVGFGSSYYHWAPSDPPLTWDRLPITLGFMAIFANLVEERVSEKAGRALLMPLLALGIISVVVWRMTDDLRLYGWVVFFPILVLPVLFWLFPPKYTGTANWFIAAGLYGASKLTEVLDWPIMSLGGVVSGHTLKHLFVAAAAYVLYRNFATRRPLSAGFRSSPTLKSAGSARRERPASHRRLWRSASPSSAAAGRCLPR